MYLHRYQLGETIGLLLACKDGSNTPVVPDNPPQAVLWAPDDTKLLQKEMPILDRYSTTGLFLLPVFLGHQFTTGSYRVTYNWTSGSGTYTGMSEDGFEIVAGGHEDGRVIATHFFQRPDATFVVQQYDSGKVKASRNPKIL